MGTIPQGKGDSARVVRFGRGTFYFRNADSQLQWGEPDWLPVSGVFAMD